MRMCPLCDTVYDPTLTAEATIHEHREPQNGDARFAWLGSGLAYDVWIKQTQEGRVWALRSVPDETLNLCLAELMDWRVHEADGLFWLQQLATGHTSGKKWVDHDQALRDGPQYCSDLAAAYTAETWVLEHVGWFAWVEALRNVTGLTHPYRATARDRALAVLLAYRERQRGFNPK